MSKTMTKKQKAALMRQMSGVPPAKRRTRRKKKSVNPAPSNPPQARPGTKKNRKRARGKGAVTTAGNTRNFTIPIDEDVGVIMGTTTFGVAVFNGQAMALNPGNPNVFPFASKIAQNYERYEFTKLAFFYRPSVSAFATAGSQGFVGLSATMDASQAIPSSQPAADVMLHSPVVQTSVPTSLTLPKHFLQSKSAREKFFVRQNGNIPGNASVHDYDCGIVFAWTDGQANTNQVGLIRVVGECILSNPLSEPSLNPPINTKVSTFTSVNEAAGPTTTTISLNPNLASAGNFNPLGISLQNGVFTLPAGNYLITLSGDADGSVGNAALGISVVLQMRQIGPTGVGTITGPNISASQQASATGALTPHLPMTYTWMAQSSGGSASTTVEFRATATYSAGTMDYDYVVSFLAV